MLNKIINIERTHSWVDGNKAIKSISLFGWIIYRNKNKAIANYNLEKSLNIISNLEKQDCEKDKYLTREISNYLHELHTFEPSNELADSLSKLVAKFRLRKATKELGRIKERNSLRNQEQTATNTYKNLNAFLERLSTYMKNHIQTIEKGGGIIIDEDVQEVIDKLVSAMIWLMKSNNQDESMENDISFNGQC